jgi:hypothetical protein
MTPTESLLIASQRTRTDKPDRASRYLERAMQAMTDDLDCDAGYFVVRIPTESGYLYLDFQGSDSRETESARWTTNPDDAQRFCEDEAFQLSRRWGGASPIGCDELS